MASRGEFFARAWDSQPQEAVQPATDIGWAGLWIGGDSRSLVSGRDDGRSNVTRSVGRGGVAFDVPSGTPASALLLKPAELPTQGCTLFVLGASSGSNTAGHIGTDGGQSIDRLGVHLPYGPDGAVYFDFGGFSEGTNRLSVGGLSFAESDVWAFTTGPRGMEIWQNGVRRASNSANPTRFNTALTAWGIQDNGSGGQIAGPAKWFALGLVGRQLTDSAVAAMTSSQDAFYQLALAPRRIWVPVAAAGGGATNLTLAEAAHGHTADSLVLTTSTALAIADATHGHTADSLTLSTGTALAVADATHAHSADALVLTTASALAVADATHAHTADNLTLDVTGSAVLVVADATHAHAADGLDLTSAQAIAIASAMHGHTADAVALAVQAWLAVNDATHGHSADNVDLSSAPILGIADALHGHAADALALTADSLLVVDDALHGHATDNITLTATGGAAGAADVWNYVFSSGLTAEATLVSVRSLLLELHQIHGLEAGSPLSVGTTTRTAAAIVQDITEVAGVVTVTRQ